MTELFAEELGLYLDELGFVGREFRNQLPLEENWMALICSCKEALTRGFKLTEINNGTTKKTGIVSPTMVYN